MVNAAQNIDPQRLEALGPAEHVVRTLTNYTDHLIHNRPGWIQPDPSANIGAKWAYALWKTEGDQRVVYERLPKVRKQPERRVKIGVLGEDMKIRNEQGQIVGRFMNPGLYEEAIVWVYRQIAEIWKMDNDFSAHFASWSWGKDHRDFKNILAAFMLVQSRAGEPVMENGKVAFFDDDFRAVGEAMCLLRGKYDINPKMLRRIRKILDLEGVAQINRELGFSKSAREPAMGRYPGAVRKWLRSKERNPKLLEGLVKSEFKETVKALSRSVGYKPESPVFCQTLRWKQDQAKDGRRVVALDAKIEKADTWEGLSEAEICQRITKDRMGYKGVVGRLPPEIGLTRAIMMAVIEAGGLSDKDMIIYSPTIEELGLHEVPAVKARLDKAVKAAEGDQRGRNVGSRVKDKALKAKLDEAADIATAKAMEEVTRNLRVYVVVDKSGSMHRSLEVAKSYLTKFLGGFPLDRTHVSVFNSMGTEVTLKTATATGVEHAFSKHQAGGGTSYAEGVRAIAHHKPEPGEDLLVIFVGDEGDYSPDRLVQAFTGAGLRPVAFGLLLVPGDNRPRVVQQTAAMMGIPCFRIEEGLFNDPYTITRTLRNLIATTPVGQHHGAPVDRAPRKTLVQEILETPLLKRPRWAA